MKSRDDLTQFVRGETVKALVDRVDATVEVLKGERAHTARSRVSANGTVSRPKPHRNYLPVDVRNTSSSARLPFEVLGITGSVEEYSEEGDSFMGTITLEGYDGALPDHIGKVAVLLDYTPAGEIGDAVLSGVIQVRLNVVSTSHTFAYIEDGGTGKMKTGYGGSAQILAMPSNTGAGVGVVRLGEPVSTRYHGTLMTAMSTSVESVQVENLEAIQGPSISEDDVTVYNRYRWAATSGADCSIEWSIENERFEFYQVNC